MSMNFIIKGIKPDQTDLVSSMQWDLSELSRKYPMTSFSWKESGVVSCPQEDMPILDDSDAKDDKRSFVRPVTGTFNEWAIRGLSVGTAFFRSGWDEHTTVSEVESHRPGNGWDEIIEIAEGYLRWVGLPDDGLTRDDVLHSIWGHEDWEEYLESQE